MEEMPTRSRPRGRMTGRRRWLSLLGVIALAAPVGLVVGQSLDDPKPTSLPASSGAAVQVPGGVGTLVRASEARLVAEGSGASVWEAPSADGQENCSITQISVDFPVSVSCGLPEGGIEEEIFTFDGGRMAGAAYRAVVRVAPSATSVTVDGKPMKVVGGLVVFEPSPDAKVLRVVTPAGEKTLDLGPFVAAPPPAP